MGNFVELTWSEFESLPMYPEFSRPEPNMIYKKKSSISDDWFCCVVDQSGKEVFLPVFIWGDWPSCDNDDEEIQSDIC